MSDALRKLVERWRATGLVDLMDCADELEAALEGCAPGVSFHYAQPSTEDAAVLERMDRWHFALLEITDVLEARRAAKDKQKTSSPVMVHKGDRKPDTGKLMAPKPAKGAVPESGRRGIPSNYWRNAAERLNDLEWTHNPVDVDMPNLAMVARGSDVKPAKGLSANRVEWGCMDTGWMFVSQSTDPRVWR